MSSHQGSARFNKWRWLEQVAETTSLSDAVKLYAVAFCKAANEHGYLWANHEQLESWIGHTSTGKSSKKAKALADGGWIQISKKKLSNGFLSNGYQLRFPTNVGTNTVERHGRTRLEAANASETAGFRGGELVAEANGRWLSIPGAGKRDETGEAGVDDHSDRSGVAYPHDDGSVFTPAGALQRLHRN